MDLEFSPLSTNTLWPSRGPGGRRPRVCAAPRVAESVPQPQRYKGFYLLLSGSVQKTTEVFSPVCLAFRRLILKKPTALV